MRYLIISDIHGKSEALNHIINSEKYDELIILGDLFSYGYENNDSKKDIIETLQKNKNKLILIKGNCDYFINYESLNLNPIDIITLHLNNQLVTLTHGHKYNKGFLPSYHGNIFISGHTHVPIIEVQKDIIYANPGSISYPRNKSDKSYLLFTEDKLILKTIDQKIIKEVKIKSAN